MDSGEAVVALAAESMESALGAAEDGAAGTLKSAAGLTSQLRKAKAAAATGQVRELRRALDTAVSLTAELAGALARLRANFTIDETSYLASGAYAKELLATAAERGVDMFEEDERLLCYPSLVKVAPGDSAIEVDRRREKRLRPSVVVGLLAAAQQRPPRFRAQQFLESLASGYELVVAREGKKPDAVARLIDVWAVLTLLPGQGKDYTRQEFSRDLYLLDQSGAAATKGGRMLRWHASSGTRTAGVLTTVARTGQQQRYWGVSFTAAETR